MSLATQLPVTSITAAPLILLYVALAFRVALLRRQNKVGLGDGENRLLAKAIGAHANASENIPIALLLLAIAELQAVNTVFLSVLAVVFVFARLIHAWGLSHHAGTSFGRMYGILLTWGILTLLAGANLIIILV